MTSIKTETPEETRRRISEEKRRRLLDGNRRVASLDEPMRDPATVLELARLENKLRDAEAEAASLRILDAKKHRKAIKRLENTMRGYADQLSQLQEVERDAYLILGEAREPVLRALQRGEVIQAKEAETADFARDEHGARIINRGGPMRGLPALVYSRGLRAKNLTGIEHAYADGRLGEQPHAERRLDVGRHYGECYEIVMGMTSTSGEGGGGFGPKGPQPRVIEAGQDFRDLRAGLSDRQKLALDQVCGKSLRVGQAAAAIKADPRTVQKLLATGLDDAGRSIAAERSKRAGKVDVAA